MVDLLQGYLIIVLEIIYCKIFFDTFCKQNISIGCSQYVCFFVLSIADFIRALTLSEYFILKYYESTSKGILFLCKVNDMSKINMKNKDIALLLSNLLNNAIEACEKIEGQKYIKIKLILKNNKLILSVKNPYNGKLFRINDQLGTSNSVNPIEKKYIT